MRFSVTLRFSLILSVSKKRRKVFLSIAGLTKMNKVKEDYDTELSYQMGTRVLISDVVEDKKNLSELPAEFCT